MNDATGAVRKGGHYRHKTGELYRVLDRVRPSVFGTGGHAVTFWVKACGRARGCIVTDNFRPGEPVVLYEHVDSGMCWARPEALFDDPERFQYVGDTLEEARGKLFSGSPAPARPSWDETGMDLARVFAQRSADEKFKVGAAILSNTSHAVVSLGVNGRYPGCPTEARADAGQGRSEMLHAEQNAIVRSRWEHGESHTLYATMEPCHECALLILAARHITRVVYAKPYAGDGVRRRGSEILKDAGVEVVQCG
ncbi:deoxycytidylate deaminase [Deinococcus aerophilus]|uniref:CMP/dCMP-type deaminase domain-containing protein n=1 Tax=Deinococcus aerophilus TaxID=522488 RepID=A0ABQ2GW59_9DEIO|nr:hypothetical protein [Deinococcus aerophilus]GGM16342.1 hypothetical protein GCM10010841_25850 [Deinococcus aerophilus]